MNLVSSGSNVSWHAATIEDIAARLGSNISGGLTDEEAARQRLKFGLNQLGEASRRAAWRIFFDQFKSLVVGLLLVAAFVALGLGDAMESAAILSVVVLNALIGFLTEWKADRTLAALRKTVVPVAHVVRDGREQQIPAAELVPGDLVVLSAGARVPADGRIVECAGLQIDESALTGESMAVSKVSDDLLDEQASLGDRLNMAYVGTTVTNGRGRLLVTETGPSTELGKIGAMIGATQAPRTPLEQKLDDLGRLLVVVVLALCGIIVAAGWLAGADSFWRMFEVGVALAIAAVPEGLPAVATMTLAIGMQRMARKGALIRRLPAVETLGSTTVICTDKTGTLTKNEMTATVFLLWQRRIEVTGTGYHCQGDFREDGRRVDANRDTMLALALRAGCLCNDATMDHQNGKERSLGDPTEAALVVAAEKGLGDVAIIRGQFPRLDEVPFDSATKRMITVHRTPDGELIAFVKGSPGTLLRTSDRQQTVDGEVLLTDVDREYWEEKNHALAAGALRVLGLAFRRLPEKYSGANLDRELVFVGLVGLIDPLRDEAKGAIAKCREAGIRTIMITGDQPATASEIASQLEIHTDFQGRPLQTVHARDLAALDAEGWRMTSAGAAVFARVSPAEKLHIVEALQAQGHIVAMTGDGVNDAPALKKADIGVVMGIKGTEVAKESADIVITDDNFATIVSAVEQGRIIYSNILRFVHYLFSCNLSEVLTVFAAIIVGWPLPMGALQLLWLNIVTDVFPALALRIEPSSPDAMKRPPINPRQALLGASFLGLILWQGVLLAAVTLLAFGIGLRKYGAEGEGLDSAVTMAFMTISLAEVFHAFSVRSRIRSAFGDRLLTNGWLWSAVLLCVALQVAAVTWPPLQTLLHTSRPDAFDWSIILVCSLCPVAVIELVKLTQRRMHRGSRQIPGEQAALREFD